jgi:hypothetical protein
MTVLTTISNPNLIFAYAPDGSYGHNSLGGCISGYIKGAIWRLNYFLESQSHGAEGVAEINELASSHTLTLLPDVEKRNKYGGVEVKDGELRILFAEDQLGTNIDNCLEELEEGYLGRPTNKDNLPMLTKHTKRSTKQPRPPEPMI